MPSVRYYNQTSPFWDFVADLENQGNNHPFFGGRSNNSNEHERADNPWANGFGGGWPFGPMPHRGRHGPTHGRHHHGPPSPPGPPPPPNHEHHGTPPPPPAPHTPPQYPEAGPSEPRDPPTSCPEEPTGPPPYQGHGQHHGPGSRRGRCGGRGGWDGRGRGGTYGFPMGNGAPPFLNNLAEMFQSQLFGDGNNDNNEACEGTSSDFKPEVDIFDTPESFVVHVSLPGAKKEDVGVNWDAEKSELSVAGVVYRPGDEELLKSLALDERKVGAFERKVRLGSRANPAQVDVDAISAKMEDGVLRVLVPKQDAEYVEIKKVDIE